MDDYHIPVLVDAKTEYTKHLTNFLISPLFEGIRSIYDQSKQVCQTNDEEEKVLITFQDLLSDIPRWSQAMVEEETHRILSNSCDWLEDLVTAVFVSHTKILTAIRVGKKHKQINLKIPKIEHFLHRVYIDLAREFWKNPYLLNDEINKIEYQRNMRISEEIISSSITETIRKQLPVKHILKEYLGDSYKDEYEDDITESDSSTHQEYIQQMAKKEGDIAAEEFNLMNDNSNSEGAVPAGGSSQREINIEKESAAANDNGPDSEETASPSQKEIKAEEKEQKLNMPPSDSKSDSPKGEENTSNSSIAVPPVSPALADSGEQCQQLSETTNKASQESALHSDMVRSETAKEIKEVPLQRKDSSSEVEKSNNSRIVPLEKPPSPKAPMTPVQVIKNQESPKTATTLPLAGGLSPVSPSPTAPLVVHDPMVVAGSAVAGPAGMVPSSIPDKSAPSVTPLDLDKDTEISLDNLTPKLETVQLDYDQPDFLSNGPEQIKQEVKQELSEHANTINLTDPSTDKTATETGMSFFDDAIENDPDLLVNV